MPVAAIIPFVFMLALQEHRPLELVPKQQDIVDGYGPALIQWGDPLMPEHGPLYAELVDGVINNKVKVFYIDTTSDPVEYYYYRVEPSGNMSITIDRDEATTLQMLPTNSSDLDREGEFYLGYETDNFTITPVNATLNSYKPLCFELMLESAAQEGDTVVTVVGIISSYYHYYFV